jgi:hypothetical protein
MIPAKSDSVDFAVSVRGDATVEPDESFTVTLDTPVHAVIVDTTAVCTIRDEDGPPAVPAPFVGVFTGGPVALHWGANVEPDFECYRLYRDTSASFVPGAGNLLVTKPDTGYVDTTSSWAYYKLSAVDSTGHESGFATISPGGQAVGSTPTGTNVPVPLSSNLELTFQNVTGAGETEVTLKTSGPPPPGGLKVAPSSPPLYYQITTTATFTGAVTVCVTYDPTYVSANEANLRLMHLDTELGAWVEITTSVDVVANVICGDVTHFSDFALMEPTGPVEVPEPPPTLLLLYPCAPNPTRGQARLRYDLPVASPVRLDVFDLQGRLVRRLEPGSRVEAGRHVVPWDGRGSRGERLRAGVYFLRLEAMGAQQVRRFVIAR